MPSPDRASFGCADTLQASEGWTKDSGTARVIPRPLTRDEADSGGVGEDVPVLRSIGNTLHRQPAAADSLEASKAQCPPEKRLRAEGAQQDRSSSPGCAPHARQLKTSMHATCTMAGTAAVVAALAGAPASPMKGGSNSSSSSGNGSLRSLARQCLRNPGACTAAQEQPRGREAEYSELQLVLDKYAASGQGSCLFVTGLPGTGKTLTVGRALDAAQRQARALQGPGRACYMDADGHTSSHNTRPSSKLRHVWINCMAATSVSEVCAQLATGLAAAGSSSPSSESTFRTMVAALRRAAASSMRPVLVLDEMDHLLAVGSTRGCNAGSAAGSDTGAQAELYELLSLPYVLGMQVQIIAIANSIDLTERALPALRQRGLLPQLVTFRAYTAAQIVAILTAALDKVPQRLFEASALQLCARSVASSSGDVRTALKACRLALTALPPVAASGDGTGGCVQAPATVTVRLMAGALTKLADARCSQLGAVHAARMRSLPNQQQLLLYALSVLCPKAEGGAVPDPTHSTTHPPDGLWGKPSWVPPAKRSRTGAVLADASCTRPAAGKGGPVALCSGIVSLSDAHAQYMRVCRVVGLTPCSLGELRHMAELLAQMALIDITQAPASRSGGLHGRQRSLLRAGRKGGDGCSLALALRATMGEVADAMAHNPALRCLVATEPHGVDRMCASTGATP